LARTQPAALPQHATHAVSLVADAVSSEAHVALTSDFTLCARRSWRWGRPMQPVDLALSRRSPVLKWTSGISGRRSSPFAACRC